MTDIESLQQQILELTKRIELLEKNNQKQINKVYDKPFEPKIIVTQNDTGYIISGNSYQIKDYIKCSGGRFQTETKSWFISNENKFSKSKFKKEASDKDLEIEFNLLKSGKKKIKQPEPKEQCFLDSDSD